MPIALSNKVVLGDVLWSHFKKVLGTEPDHKVWWSDRKVKKSDRNSYICTAQLYM